MSESTSHLTEGIDPPVSETAESLLQETLVTLEELDRTYDEQRGKVCSLFLRKANELALCNVHADALEDMKKRAEAFFAQPLPRLCRDELIPAIFCFMQNDEAPLQEVLQKAADLGVPDDVFAMIKESCGEWQEEFSRTLRPVERYGVVHRQIALHFHPQGILLVRINGKKGKNTLAISEIAEHGSWEMEDDIVDFCEIDIHFPLVARQPCSGEFDPFLGVSWVDRNSHRTLMHEMQQVWRKRLATGGLDFIVREASKYPDRDTLLASLNGLALCEEVKHQINTIRKFQTSSPENDCFREYLAFAEQRIVPGHKLMNLWQSYSDPEEQYVLARAIEESNAKLAALAFGPDPSLALSDLQTRLLIGKRRHPAVPHETEIILGMLTNGNMKAAMHPKSYDHLHKDQAALRTLAFTALQEAFAEDWKQTPFCALESDGQLRMHARTHPAFAKWADTSQKNGATMMRKELSVAAS